MKLFAIAMLAATLGLTAQDEAREARVVVKSFNSVGGGHAVVKYRAEDGLEELNIQMNDGSLVIDPAEIAIGDTLPYALDNGETVNVKRTENALFIYPEGAEEPVVLTTTGEGGERIIVHADSGANVMTRRLMRDAVVINGLSDASEEVKQTIIDALRAAGVEKEVLFSPGPQMLWIDDQGGRHNPGDAFIFTSEEGHTVEVDGGSGKTGVFIVREKKEEQ